MNTRPFSERTKRILEAAPALAESGLSKTEAARALGVPVGRFVSVVPQRT